jgi:uncharacterized protein YgiM (DUF1202 family)
MPNNIRLSMFAFGAILILIGILGGKFKLFRAEIAAKVSNPILRFVSLALGTFLLVTSILNLNTIFPPECKILVRDPTAPLNIRESPNGKIIGTLPSGEILKVKRNLRDWLVIEYKGGEGFVHSKLTKEECNSLIDPKL